MAEYNLGRVAFFDKGTYSPEDTYNKWDFVTTVDSTYLFIDTTPQIGKPVTDTNFWKCIANGKPATLAAAAADLAKEAANSAATLANEKAILAQSAATLANTKAGLANDAAVLATDKASLADSKATLANEKAILAQSAADNANAKAADVTAAVLSAGSLGSIKPTDAAPTPARNGNYTFSIGGAKPAWLTAEAGVTTVKAGDGVAVVYTAPSTYSYTHVNVSSDLASKDELAEVRTDLNKLDTIVNGGKYALFDINGNGTDIFIPRADFEREESSFYVTFKVTNPLSNFSQYGIGISSDGSTYTYKNVEWDDISNGIGHVVVVSATTHLVVTNAVKQGTSISFYSKEIGGAIPLINSNKSALISVRTDLNKVDTIVNGGHRIAVNAEGNSINQFILKRLYGLTDPIIYFKVSNPLANFAQYGFASSVDGQTLASYALVIWDDYNLGLGHISISTDYIAVTNAVKQGTVIELYTPLYEGVSPIYAHKGIVSFIDDDSGSYVPDIWGPIISQTSIRMGFACVSGYMSGLPATSVYQPMSIEYLRSLYNDGHEVYSHSWTHPSFYEESVSLEEVNFQCWKSKDWLLSNGFVRNSDIIVYPGGLGENKIEKQNIVRRHYKYGVDTVGGGINTEPLKKKLCIYRYNADTATLEQLKAKVDIAVQENKLLVLMNHAYQLNLNKDVEVNKIISLINYIKSTGAVIAPLHEALNQIYGI